MKRVLCPVLPKPGRPSVLPEAEAAHATKVLRLRDGDLVEALDGRGNAVQAHLRVKGGPVRLEWSDGEVSVADPARVAQSVVPLVLEMAVLKGDAMEWVVEKSVELGVRELVPVLTAHTVVQMKNKGPEAFQERWQKIADQALKQCGRLDALRIGLPVELEVLMSKPPLGPRLWCDENSRDTAPPLARWLTDQPSKPAALRILVGPEGGWSELERELLVRTESTTRVALGPLVLRAETAALFSVSLAVAQLRQA